MLKKYGLVLFLLLISLPVMAQDGSEPSISFVIEGTENGEFDRIVDAASWSLAASEADIRTGIAFDLSIQEVPGAGDTVDGVELTIAGLPLSIEAGTYGFGMYSTASGSRATPQLEATVVIRIEGRYVSNTFSSTSTLTITERTEDSFSGEFLMEFRDGTITGKFDQIPIPDVSLCVATVSPDAEEGEDDVLVQFAAESDATIADLNFTVEDGVYLTAYTPDTWNDDTWYTTLQFASPFDQTGELSFGMIIRFEQLPVVLEEGDYEVIVPVSSFDVTPQGHIEYLPGLGNTDRMLAGVLTISDVSDGKVSGSYELSVIGDDFFDDMEEPFGTVTGAFENIPLSAETECRVQSGE